MKKVNQKNDHQQSTRESPSTSQNSNLINLVEGLSLNDQIQSTGKRSKISNAPKKCHYCKLDKEKFLVKCNDCSLYFCNQKGQLKESHIVHHLIRAEHNDVDFNLKRVSGNGKACNLCDCKNIFNLGILMSNQNNRYLLCRAPCKSIQKVEVNGKLVAVEKPFFKDYNEYFETLRIKFPHLFINGEATLRGDGQGKRHNFQPDTKFEIANISNWRPLVSSDKVLISFILDQPNRTDSIRCKPVNQQEVEKIEKELEHSNDLIGENDLNQVYEPVLLVYENGSEYCDVFYHLMELEVGIIQKLSEEENIGRKVVFDRVVKALDKFEINKMKMNDEIYEVILGHNKIKSPKSDILLNPTDYQAPNLPELNQSQALAIKHALENPFTLIQGPPGTGKTYTLASIVHNLYVKQSGKKEQILVCAQSNAACDNLAAKIKRTKLNVVRLLSRTKERDNHYHSPLSIHNLLKYPDPNSDLGHFIEILISKEKNVFNKKEKRELEKLEKKYLNMILDKADVIVVTCVAAADNRLKGKKFKYLLIDEVSQSTELEVLIPLNSYERIQKLILVGDIQQLSPVVKNKIAVNAGFDQSMMQRLTLVGNSIFMLDTQYRMHPIISKFSSENFYNGKLKDGVTENDQILVNSTFKWPNDKRNFFFSCKEEEQISVKGHSYLNAKEGCVIGKLVFKLINSGIRPNQIGIITPYEAQINFFRNNLKFFSKDINYDQIEIASINSFQGKEKDIIIFSTVRSNSFKGKKRSIGFLGDVRRLNVALTRAKYGLIIVGDESTLCSQQVWYKLLKFYQDNKMMFKGSIDNPIPFKGNLPTPSIVDEKCFELKNNYHIKRMNATNGTVEYVKI